MYLVEMSGRLGNQLFRYAFVRWLQLRVYHSQKPILMDFSVIEREAKKGEMPGWEDSLQHFCVLPYKRYPKKGKIIHNETSVSEKTILGLLYIGDRALKRTDNRTRLAWWKLFANWLNAQGIYKSFVGYDYAYTVSDRKNPIVAGPFECARYCEEIREELLKELVPKYPVLDKNKEILSEIGRNNSVCITVRRGNFLKYPLHNVCQADYYEKAVLKIRTLLKDPVFFVFSDDIEWVRKNVRIDGKVYYEDGTDPVWEKLRLMYSCRHFIISNSTFSWWAQFLGQYPDKVVIAPSRWHNDPYQPPLFEDGWITIDIGE